MSPQTTSSPTSGLHASSHTSSSPLHQPETATQQLSSGNKQGKRHRFLLSGVWVNNLLSIAHSPVPVPVVAHNTACQSLQNPAKNLATWQSLCNRLRAAKKQVICACTVQATLHATRVVHSSQWVQGATTACVRACQLSRKSVLPTPYRCRRPLARCRGGGGRPRGPGCMGTDHLGVCGLMLVSIWTVAGRLRAQIFRERIDGLFFSMP